MREFVMAIILSALVAGGVMLLPYPSYRTVDPRPLPCRSTQRNQSVRHEVGYRPQVLPQSLSSSQNNMLKSRRRRHRHQYRHRHPTKLRLFPQPTATLVTAGKSIANVRHAIRSSPARILWVRA